jgi:type IV pilus assembly protein PilA
MGEVLSVETCFLVSVAAFLRLIFERLHKESLMKKQNDLRSLQQSAQGFTLVELMVVVAIIGILSSVAVPNFKRYQAQSKTAEAKLQLSALYSAQTSAFAEYGAYVACLRAIGYDPSAERLSRYYAVGFSATSLSNAIALNNGLGTCAAGGAFQAGASAADTDFGYGATKNMGGTAANTVGHITTIAATVNGVAMTANVAAGTGSTFVAAAGGPIHPDFLAVGTAQNLAAGHDMWVINESKVLGQYRRGY